MTSESRFAEWPGNHMDQLGTYINIYDGRIGLTMVVAGVSYKDGVTTARLEPTKTTPIEQARRLEELS